MNVFKASFQRAADQFERTVASIGQPSWVNETPCRVSIRELVEHVIAGNEFAIRLLTGATADEARTGLDRIRLGADPVRQVSTSCAAQTEAFAATDRTRRLHHPSGDIDHETFVW